MTSDDSFRHEAESYLAARRDAGRSDEIRTWLAVRELEDCPVHLVMRPSVALMIAEFLELCGLDLAVAPTDPQSMPALLVVPSQAVLWAAFAENRSSEQVERQPLGLLDLGEASEVGE